MCGITGIFSFEEKSKAWPEAALREMVRAISHRGPDGSDFYTEPGLFIGHARLAVLDLSVAGRQPMFSHDRRYVISFNGEIYNYQELKNELTKKGYCFFTRSDTEVLLAVWSEWGEEGLSRLDGIFAFALFDRFEETLFLVRDSIGVKPLFYQTRDGSLFFASELLALFGSLNPCPPDEHKDLDFYFTFNYLHAPRTGLKGVLQLPPGSLLRVNASGQALKRYWQPKYSSRPTPWNEDTVNNFRQIFFDTVKAQTVADVPLGVLLSGGLDSYSVALAVSASGKPFTSFTLGFAEANFDETSAASENASYLGVHGEFVQFDWNESIIEKTLDAMNELLADASCFPMYQLADFVRKSVPVVLSGDGGDELLAGYDTYRAGAVTPLVRMFPKALRRYFRSFARYLPSDNQRYGKRMVVERLIDAAEAGTHRDHASFRRIFSEELKHRLYREDFRRVVACHDPIGVYAGLMDNVPPERSYLTKRISADIAFHLPSILAQVDRMSMAHGLEVRVPFLGRRMIEFCLNLDDACLSEIFSGKRILRKMLAGSVPSSALKRPKAGFLPPVDSWFRGNGPMNAVMGDYLLTAGHSLDILKWDEVERFWQDHRHGRVEGGYVLLGILQYINLALKCKNLR